jgi:hypothetical protein
VARKVKIRLPSGEMETIKNVLSNLDDRIAAERFVNQTADEEDFIPLDYDPSNTTWPENGWDHRRTSRAGYRRSDGTLRIQFFSNGAIYDYHNVPVDVARRFRRVESPGKFINAVLNGYEYEKIG